MPLRGCVRIHCLPLQVLLADNPSWKGTPVAVTRDERPQSPILALNRPAREKGLTEGVRYASALSLVPGLRARKVPPARIQQAHDRVAKLLSSFTPDIEPCPFDQDVFWVSVEGLRSLFGNESRWILEARAALKSSGFASRIVVGFTRFGTYVLSRAGSRSTVLSSREEERALVERSPIDALPLPPKTRMILRRLEVRTIRQFVSLPPGETERRLGKEAGRLRAAMDADDPLPIQPLQVRENVPCRRRLDAPLADVALLLPHIEELLQEEAARVEAERCVIAGLVLTLHTEDGEAGSDLIRPAVPTSNTAMLMRLIQLRLADRHFRAGVERIEIRCVRARPSRKQEELFGTRGRDLAAGARAFAVIRARFGEHAVSVARPVSSHLPEQSFQWAALDRPVLPSALPASPAGNCPAAVRRIFTAPSQLAVGASRGSRAADLFVSTGGWAEGADAAVSRAYRFERTRDGISWIYDDRVTGSTWKQGVVD